MITMMMIVIMSGNGNSDDITISTSSLSSPFVHNVPCMSNSTYEGTIRCTSPKSGCKRFISDGVFSMDDIAILRAIATKALKTRSDNDVGGPTIIDINTGYMRDTIGLKNLFAGETQVFDDVDFSHYGRIIKKLKG